MSLDIDCADRRHGDDPQSAPSRAARHLDRDRGGAAGGEDDQHVVRPEGEVVEDDLGEARASAR